jgi:hypothetical protein
MVDVGMLERPDADALALWLADTVLAHHLKSPAPVPLNAGQIRRSDLRTPGLHRLGDSPQMRQQTSSASLLSAHHIDAPRPLRRERGYEAQQKPRFRIGKNPAAHVA